jgi:hypothetical protein
MCLALYPYSRLRLEFRTLPIEGLVAMKRTTGTRRRPAVHITLTRAARLHRLVMVLAAQGQTREKLLSDLNMGLRTFYRELELLKRCGVKVRLAKKLYVLHGTAQEAEGRLPFPDPQLSFAEMAELSQGPGAAAKRLAELLASVVNPAAQPARGPKSRRGPRGKRGTK